MLVAVAALTLSCVGIAAALGTQILHIAESLPQYESNVQRKLKTLEEVTVGPILTLSNETSRLTRSHQAAESPRDVENSPPGAASGVAVLPPPEFESHPPLLVWKLLTTVWHPLQFAGIVLLVLIFALLEYESLRDRFILIAGTTDIRTATLALNDAGDRLSRYFVSQFAVNFGFGLAVWMSLCMLRLPQALLCGILAGVMRFVPYVGVAIAALFAAVLALAVDPGWSLAFSGLGVFIVLDIVVRQLVEPHLYGHATGLSPLASLLANVDEVTKRAKRSGIAIRLILLTAVRRSELTGARWSEVDLEAKAPVWDIPAKRTKTGVAFAVPLTPPAVDQFRRLKRLAGRSPWVFPAETADEAMDPRLLTRSIARHLETFAEHKVGAFTLHDLRRTVRTGLARLGIRPDIAERCLNHAQPGIIETYDTHHYLEEKRDTLTRWANHLQLLRNGS